MQETIRRDIPLSKFPRTIPSRVQLVSGVSGTIPVSDGVSLVSVNASSGAITMQLPDATGRAGHVVTIIKNDSGGNAVTVGTFVSSQMGPVTSYSLPSQYSSTTVVSDGTKWMQTGRQQPHRDSFSGDGSTTNFTLAANNNAIGTETVSRGGVIEDPANYTATQTQIQFVTAPVNGERVLVWYQT